jgi:cyclic pyranopterin phosphate synthase
MPFNGEGTHYPTLNWTYKKILEYIQQHYALIKIPDAPSSTSYNYKVAGYKGNVGVIAAFSRTFCGTCNRIRITAQGTLKTCLYDDGALDSRAKDGFEAEARRQNHLPVSESMSTIGG